MVEQGQLRAYRNSDEWRLECHSYAKEKRESGTDKAGATDYFCKFHPNMKGRVTVALEVCLEQKIRHATGGDEPCLTITPVSTLDSPAETHVWISPICMLFPSQATLASRSW